MTWDAHSSVGVAQAVFYAPVFLASIYLLFFKHGKPILPWLALFTFSAVRIAGGIILALFVDHQDDVGYIIAGLVLQGTGVVPLILSTIGMLVVM